MNRASNDTTPGPAHAVARALAALCVRRWWAAILIGATLGLLAWPIARPLAITQTLTLTLAEVRAGEGGVFVRRDPSAPVETGTRIVVRGAHDTLTQTLTLPGGVGAALVEGPSATGRVTRAAIATRILGVDAGTADARAWTADPFAPGTPARITWLPWGGVQVLLALLGLGAALGASAAMVARLAMRGGSVATATLVAWTLVLAAHAWFWTNAPTLITKDCAVYVLVANGLLEGKGFDALIPTRPPGISLVLAPFIAIDAPWRWTVSTGMTLMALVAAWAAWRIARRAAGPAPAVAVLLLVGLDPYLLGFSRTLGSEIPATCLALAACWLVACRTWGRSLAADLAKALLLGLLVGAAALVRANFQVLLVLLPASAGYLVLAARWRGGMPWRPIGGVLRGAAVGGLALAIGLAVIAPIVLHHGRTHGVYALSLFGDTTRLTSLLQTGVIAPSDAGPVDADAFAEIRTGFEGNMVAFRFRMLELAGAQDTQADMERVAREVVARAAQRDPGGVAGTVAGALAVQLGLLPAQRVMRTSHSYSVLRPLARNPWSGARSNFTDEPRARQLLGNAVVDRNRESVGPLQHNLTGDFYSRLFEGYGVIRPALGVLGIIGVAVALVRGREGVALVGAVALAHAVALALVALTPVERYQFPVWPVVVAVGAACFAPRTKNAGPSEEGPAKV